MSSLQMCSTGLGSHDVRYSVLFFGKGSDNNNSTCMCVWFVNATASVSWCAKSQWRRKLLLTSPKRVRYHPPVQCPYPTVHTVATSTYAAPTQYTMYDWHIWHKLQVKCARGRAALTRETSLTWGCSAPSSAFGDAITADSSPAGELCPCCCQADDNGVVVIDDNTAMGWWWLEMWRAIIMI